jgi:hypothetical protein
MAEAELYGLAAAAPAIKYHRGLMEDMGMKQTGRTPLYGDNESSLVLGSKNEWHRATRHVKNRAHLLHSYVTAGLIELRHIPGVKNVADILTKSLTDAQFVIAVAMQGVVNPRLLLWSKEFPSPMKTRTTSSTNREECLSAAAAFSMPGGLRE